LTDLSPDDSGMYVCTAFNPSGDAKKIYEVQVNCKTYLYTF